MSWLYFNHSIENIIFHWFGGIVNENIQIICINFIQMTHAKYLLKLHSL